MGESFPKVAVVRSNTGGISGSSSLQRKKDALMAPHPRENSRGGRISRETSGRLAYIGAISPRVVSIRSNTGETSGCCLVQRQIDAWMVPNPRDNSRGDAFPERHSGRLAYVGEISPRTVSVRLIIREASGSSLVQRQNDTLIVPNPRENSRGGGAFPERPLEG